MNVARSLGLSVPDDVSVIGFDNIPESALTEPPLTTIDQSIQKMGEEAVRLLVDLLNGGTDRPRQITAADQARRPPVVPRDRDATREHRRPRDVGADAAVPGPGAAGRRAGRRPARPDDAGGEGRPARQRLGVPARRRDGARRGRAPSCSATASARSPASPAPAAWRRVTPPMLANAIQRHLVDGDPPRHPGDRPRGDLLGADGPRVDDLPPGDRPRQHVGAGARRRPRRRRARPDAGDGRPPGPLAGARHLPRSAVGTHRGDVRRGSRTSSPGWVSRSSAACRATTSPTG